jgi:hypothetical protein
MRLVNLVSFYLAYKLPARYDESDLEGSTECFKLSVPKLLKPLYLYKRAFEKKSIVRLEMIYITAGEPYKYGLLRRINHSLH